MPSRYRSRLIAAGALIAMACGGRGDAAPRPDTLSPSKVAARPTVPPAPPHTDTASTPARVPTTPAAAATARTATGGTVARRVMIGDLDLTGVGYDVGERTAPVVVVDFSDFACPYCGEFTRETYPTLEREYVRTGKVLFKYVPFVAGTFPNGKEAARAAECAGDQGKFWPMHDSLYAQQGEWRKSRAPLGVFQRDAAALGLDSTRFDQCYATQEVHPRTRRATGIANDIGVRVTPSFVVNDRPVEGALPIADFRRVIDAALLVEKAHR